MAKAHKVTGVKPLRSYRENARIILPQKVEEVYAWESFILDETRREELHNMRIAIKRLRYTMEFFRVAYQLPKKRSNQTSVTCNKRFVEFLEVVIDLQEILGDIHDGDVVLGVLADYASQSEGQGEQIAMPRGVAKLMAQSKEARKADYATFLKKWKQLSTAGFKEKLLSFLAE
ncbi:MAG: CHAD domain-containing protein [Candidatus Poribacteria bacterium]|nr:CHAD domain-containing protein [Candidatus Poribacteria bacterium]